MLTVTNEACDRLKTLMAGLPQPAIARIVRRDGRLKLRRGKERPGDKSIQYDGQSMLLLGDPIARRLDDRILDVRETTSGPQLGFRRRD